MQRRVNPSAAITASGLCPACTCCTARMRIASSASRSILRASSFNLAMTHYTMPLLLCVVINGLISKTLKFMYQTWWVWWLPRVAMVGFIIFCVESHFDWSITAWFGAFLVLSFLGARVGRRNLTKARNKIRFKGSTTRVSMDESGVDLVGEAGNSHTKWSGILPPVVYPNGVLVKFSRFAGIWLPDRALVEGSPHDVRNLLARNIKDSETKR